MTTDAMPLLAARLFNTAVLAEPGKAEVIAAAFGARVLGVGEVVVAGREAGAIDLSFEKPSPLAGVLGEELTDHLKRHGRGYSNIGGVAIIRVQGTLVRRGAWVGQSSGMTSYEGLTAQLKAAAEDPEVRGIALELDSPGGEAAGCFELARVVRQVREVKPVRAFLADNAMSAAYAIAAQADHITVPEFGDAGSIGVIMLHAEMSKKLAHDGVTVTVIRSGALKAQGNPFEPLPADLLAAWETQVGKMRVRFAEEVGLGRGDRLSALAALGQEAGVFTGDEAVAKGLCDAVADPKAAFDDFVAEISATPAPTGAGMSRGASRTTGAEAPPKKEANMADENTQEAVTPAAGAADGGAAPNTPPAPSGPTAAEAQAAERARASKITSLVSKAGLSAEFAAELIDANLTVEAAAEKIIDKRASAAADGGDIANHAPATVGADAADKAHEGMKLAMMGRAGLEGGERNEFTGMGLREMARHSLTMRGMTIPGGGVRGMVGAAFTPSMAVGQHSTSDFTNILADVANKSMLIGFREADETFERFTKRGTLGDFKPSKRVGLDLFPALAEVKEGTEFKYGTMGDRGESIVLATYGRLFAITRQTIINDDLGAFTEVPRKMGRAARRTVGDLVFAVLTSNPAMSDGDALFHANHGNLAGSGAAPSESTLNDGITAMTRQTTGGEDNAKLNISPKFIIAAPEQRSVIMQTLNSEHAPDDTAKAGATKMSRAANTVYKAVDPIFDARLAAGPWYLAADPAAFDTIEVAYLDGDSEPFLDQQDGWTVDGTEFKVRIDAGVSPLAYQGLYSNPGA